MRSITIEVYEDELNYILTGLELFVLNLNNIWAIDKNSEEQEQRYHVLFYLYHRLLGFSNNYDNLIQIKMNKPKKSKNISEKVLTFFS